MTKPASDATKMALAVSAMLSDEPRQATAQIMTVAAVVAITAGLDDDEAKIALQAALTDLRQHGAGEATN